MNGSLKAEILTQSTQRDAKEVFKLGRSSISVKALKLIYHSLS